jgi:hypothetical protein
MSVTILVSLEAEFEVEVEVEVYMYKPFVPSSSDKIIFKGLPEAILAWF